MPCDLTAWEEKDAFAYERSSSPDQPVSPRSAQKSLALMHSAATEIIASDSFAKAGHKREFKRKNTQALEAYVEEVSEGDFSHLCNKRSSFDAEFYSQV